MTLDLLQLAGALPRDPQFREWIATFAFDGELDYCTEEMAALYIRVVCIVTSRRDLATNPEAAARFHSLIRKPFLAWREQQKEPA